MLAYNAILYGTVQVLRKLLQDNNSRCNLSTFMWNEISTVNHPPIREFHSLITSETGYLILLGGRYVNEGLPTGKMAGDAWRLQLFVNVFAMLSLDMWLAIFSYLDPKTLYSLCAVRNTCVLHLLICARFAEIFERLRATMCYGNNLSLRCFPLLTLTCS